MTGILEKVRAFFRQAATSAEHIADGEEPVATPPAGAGGDQDRETSTNAQLEGSAGEPWSGDS
jgi:hypothetical protein